MGEAPSFISCDPLAREFPSGWKDIWFRRHAHSADAGRPVVYECPLCRRVFDHSQIGFLQGDHIWPYSLFGYSTWENYRLICGSCNAARGNRLDSDIREALGSPAFRELVVAYLRQVVPDAELASDPFLMDLIATSKSASRTD